MPFKVESLKPNPLVSPVVDVLDTNYYPAEATYLANTPLLWEKETSPLSPLDEQKGLKQSIFESYDPINDAERLQKLSHLTPELQQYYIKENLLSYFEEFAAEIKVKKLSGVIKDTGEMEMVGTNVTDMYTHSAELAGKGSREDRERQGLNTIVKGLQEGNNRAVLTSPPKFADYGFVFAFIADEYDAKLQGRPFRELLLRYDEDLGSIERSKDIYNAIRTNTGVASTESNIFQTSEDFLDNPIVYSHEGTNDLHDLYQLLNISDQDIEKSEEFRKQLQPYVQPMMEEYSNLLRQMSLFDLHNKDEQLMVLEDQCRILIGGMFNTARIIARKIDRKPALYTQIDEEACILQELKKSNRDPQSMYDYAKRLAGYEELSIMGGSNCPVVQSIGSSESSFLEATSTGISFSGAGQLIAIEGNTEAKDACVTCPYCKNKKGNVKIKNKYICGNKQCSSNKR